ncbi:DUF1127 domain-containing protein [Pseudogemmobacter bohemicus]|uniref:DUF1127 domain-containing protein n=1 Tax=Pseudogemmobacter bohemicus TaxID=2250708 RepID=UPI000DD3B7AF|nr:DUF1127 domain-containing protein [Pseudogemmobacter bohemicus]
MTWQSAPARPASLPQLDRLPPVSRLLVMAGLALASWQNRKRSRLSLSRLDDRLLSDIGLPASARDSEIAKPFWRE